MEFAAGIQEVSPAEVTPRSVTLFFMHSCGYCKQFLPTFNELPGALEAAGLGDVPVYAVDIKAHQTGVAGVPHVVVRDAAGADHVFSGPRTLKNLAHFAVDVLNGGSGLSGGGSGGKKKSPKKGAKKASPKMSPKRSPAAKRRRLASLRGGEECHVEFAGGAFGEDEGDEVVLEGGKAKGSPKRSGSPKHRGSPKRSGSPTRKSKAGSPKAGSPKKRGPGRPRRTSPKRAPTVWNVALAEAYTKIKSAAGYDAFVARERAAGRNGFVRLGEGALGAKLKAYADERRAALDRLSADKLARVLAEFARERK